MADLIEQIRGQRRAGDLRIRGVPEPGARSRSADETGVEYVDELRDDDLPGAPGDAEHSWLGLMLFDYITMTDALGGDSTALRAVRGRATSLPTQADYPQ